MESPKNLLGGSNQNTPKQVPLQREPPKKVTPPTQGGGWQSKKLWISFIIGFVLGALVAWVFVGTKEGSEDLSKEDAASEESMESGSADNQLAGAGSSTSTLQSKRKEPIIVAGVNEISVQDQAPGTVVEVELARFSVPGWIAVHEDKNGELGNILGARRLDPGIHLAEVELLRGTVSGGTYHAVLYLDNGDRQFNSSDDAPIKNAEGKLIESVFKTE